MKLIREHLYEYMKFTQEGDPIKDMGIGVDELIHKWMHDHGIKKHKYRIIKNKYIIGDNTIILANSNIKQFPEFINFSYINGGFHCENNDLTSLRGCPKLVQGSFFCSANYLKSSGLIGGPKEVEGSYGASNCELESLEGIAQKIQESIYLENNRLTSLEFIPKETGNLYIQNNPIQTLMHFPKKIYGDVHITRSKILNELAVSKICSVSGKVFEY
jgi:hypothetical protein